MSQLFGAGKAKVQGSSKLSEQALARSLLMALGMPHAFLVVCRLLAVSGSVLDILILNKWCSVWGDSETLETAAPGPAAERG